MPNSEPVFVPEDYEYHVTAVNGVPLKEPLLVRKGDQIGFDADGKLEVKHVPTS